MKILQYILLSTLMISCGSRSGQNLTYSVRLLNKSDIIISKSTANLRPILYIEFDEYLMPDDNDKWKVKIYDSKNLIKTIPIRFTDMGLGKHPVSGGLDGEISQLPVGSYKIQVSNGESFTEPIRIQLVE